MVAEVGQFFLLIALTLAILQSIFPLVGAVQNRARWMVAGLRLARGHCLFVALAFGALAYLFVANDFSVLYVAHNSNSLLPLHYRISAVWGGHEGSLLLWCLMLAGWGALVAGFARRIPLAMHARIVGVLGCVSVCFLLFMIFTSNPFARLLPAAAEGRDLNPLLQDPGLIFHPPMLYMGYVGFAVTFAFAIAALLSGRMDSAWARWARPWTLAAWAFLTVGILLGSWWAYYELGWGGWWFWDPVENASFMPWLVGTALLHSLAVTEARGLFKPWTALLAILTFSLSLLGAFLVRSGVLTSVHAFATDPQRGLFILVILVATIAGALLLYAWRAPRMTSSGRFGVVSREGGILLNNVLLTAAAFCVLLGTLYPLILDALQLGKISVGPPYFNSVFVPLAGASAAVAALGVLLRWKSDALARLKQQAAAPFCCAVVAAVLLPFLFNEYRVGAAVGLALAFWILFITAKVAVARLRIAQPASGGYWGMLIAHGGVGVFVIGVTAVSAYSIEEDLILRENETTTVGKITLQLESVKTAPRENYEAVVAAVRVFDDGDEVALLHPEKRRYYAQPQNLMTEAGIDPDWHGDWYLSLGEPQNIKSNASNNASGGEVWSARLQYKPFIRFIWGGALLMALGGIIAAADRRYRRGF